MQTVSHQVENPSGRDFPVTMGVNAFRGFMNEFMTSRGSEPEKPRSGKTKRTKVKTVRTIVMRHPYFIAGKCSQTMLPNIQQHFSSRYYFLPGNTAQYKSMNIAYDFGNIFCVEKLL